MGAFYEFLAVRDDGTFNLFSFAGFLLAFELWCGTLTLQALLAVGPWCWTSPVEEIKVIFAGAVDRRLTNFVSIQ